MNTSAGVSSVLSGMVTSLTNRNPRHVGVSEPVLISVDVGLFAGGRVGDRVGTALAVRVRSAMKTLTACVRIPAKSTVGGGGVCLRPTTKIAADSAKVVSKSIAMILVARAGVMVDVPSLGTSAYCNTSKHRRFATRRPDEWMPDMLFCYTNEPIRNG